MHEVDTIVVRTMSINRMLLNAATHFINKSRTKFLVIGLRVGVGFPVEVRVCGQKNDQDVTFDEEEWYQLISQRNIDNYFKGIATEPIHINGKVIDYAVVGGKKVIKVEQSGQQVYLGVESWEKLCEGIELTNRRIRCLKALRFDVYYDKIILDVINVSGDVRAWMDSMLRGETSVNGLCMYEMLKHSWDIVEVDIELRTATAALEYHSGKKVL